MVSESSESNGSRMSNMLNMSNVADTAAPIDRRDERRAVIRAAACFFLLLGSYSVMRPVRDAFAAENVEYIHWWFTGTLAMSALIVPLFWLLISRLSRPLALRATVHLFSCMLVTFAMLFWFLPDSVTVRFVYYAWLSMYSLFILSMFWSLMADVFRFESSRRVYGYVGVGGTLGAIYGSFWVRYASDPLAACAAWLEIPPQRAPIAYLIIAILMLEAGGVFMRRLWAQHVPEERRDVRLSRTKSGAFTGFWDGLRLLMTSPYLLGIAVYVVGLTTTATVFYKAQLVVANDELAARLDKTVFFANIWLFTQLCTLVIELFLTGTVLRRLGVGIALAIVPIITMGGLIGLAAVPLASTIMIAEVVRKSANYGFAKPARETLFTVVGRAEKYQSKSFIDTFVYRGSDQIAIWLLAFLADTLLMSPKAVFIIFTPVCVIWCVMGLWLAREQRRRALVLAA
jgi:AAA family ATP:ADP antiporter